MKKGCYSLEQRGTHVAANIEPDYPSAYDFENQIIVSATDNKDRPATFSNYGSMVDIAAPGNAILSLLPKNKYRAFSGTSKPHLWLLKEVSTLLATTT